MTVSKNKLAKKPKPPKSPEPTPETPEPTPEVPKMPTLKSPENPEPSPEISGSKTPESPEPTPEVPNLKATETAIDPATEITSSTTSKNYTADHIEGIQIEEPGGDLEGEGAALIAGQVQIDAATFYEQRFKMLFDMGSEATAIPGLSPVGHIKSIAIQPQEEEVARKVSDKLYAVCQKYRLLHFLLSPGGEFVETGFVIWIFFKGKKEMIEAEIIAKLAAQQQPQSQEKAA